DLGEIQGDMLLFGGIYSNLAALDALLLFAKENAIPAQNCICTGDIVAYCADVEDSTHAIRRFGCPVLAGNCEVQLGANADDCGCGFDEGSECSLLSHAWYAHATKQVSAGNKAWMGTLPERIVFTRRGERFAVLHGGATDISRFIWPVTKDAEIATEIATLTDQVGRIDHIIAGHSGIPMQRMVDGVSWMNAGAIGMPSHNGSPDTSFGILSDNKFRIKMLPYDFNATIKAMKAAGLIQGYHETLSSGFWPSEDMLPLEMRR
ncbi:MAG: metallophosphoesterase family protein, partial [Amylibacter sp.]